MGNQPSFEHHHDFRDLQTNYTYEKKYNDNRFGEIKLLKEKNSNNKIFQKDFSSNTPKEFEDYIQQIKDSKDLAHPNILRVYGYNSKKEDLFCADFYKLSLFFESFETDLEQEISRRRRTRDIFPETELYYILECVSSACSYLQEHKILHRDIRPYNVFINAKGEYKVSAANIFRQNYNPLYFENFEGLESQSRYYSPELLQHVSTPVDKRTPIDEYKNDVFGLGMTLLEAGLLEKVEAYDYPKRTVNRAAIEGGLNRLRENYSDNFVNLVQSCLDFNPQTRLDFVSLDRELGRYRRDIKEKARGVTSSPQRNSEGRTVSLEQGRAAAEREVRAGSPERGYPNYQADDLDARVREAVRRSEAVIQKSSPTKYHNKNLDPYIQAYLRDDLNNPNQNILVAISPYLTSESKYTTTLTIEQPNYGRESQPINFSQVRPEEYDSSVKKSAFPDTASQYGQATPGYGQQPAETGNYRQAAVSFGNVEGSYQPTESLRKSGTNQYGITSTTQQYGAQPTQYGQGTLQTETNPAVLTTAQFGQGTTGTAPANTYGTSTYGTTQYGGHQDTTGALKQSGTGTAAANTYGTSTYGTTQYSTTPAQYGATTTGAAANTYGTSNYGTTQYGGHQDTGALKQSGTGAGANTYATSTYGTTQYGHQDTGALKQSGTGAGANTYGTTQYGQGLGQSGAGQYTTVTTTTYTHEIVNLGGQPSGGYGTEALKQSGSGQNYGASGNTGYTSYTTTTYGGQTGNAGSKDYAAEADELSRRIAERLNQSRVAQPQTY